MRTRILGLGVAIVAGALLVSSSGAATTQAQKANEIDVSTRAAVVYYLRSIHVNPKHAVIQRGLRNYAGAHCPGTHWTCASTKHTVVQIAKRGGQNRFVCKSNKCVVVQFSGTERRVYLAGRQAASAPTKPSGSTATCVKTGSGATSGGGQVCTINQSGSGPNLAGVYENTTKVSGLVQTAQYAATITQQSSGSNGNTACVTQAISQDGSTTNTNGKQTTANLQAYQKATITQNSPAGPNSAQYAATSTGACDTTNPVTQSQTQTSTVSATGSITQYENQPASAVPGGNVWLDIEQNQGSVKGSATGTNSAVFAQTYNQQAVASTTSGHTVIQTQSSPDGDGTSTPFSGLVGTINQDSKALSTATATQTETQCEDAFNSATDTKPLKCDTNDADAPANINLTQTQYGPEGIFTPLKQHSGPVGFVHKGYGTSAQTGAATGVHDSFTLNQTSTQNADQGNGQQNIVQGDCSSAGGSCTASQLTSLNSGTTQDGWTAPSIGNINIKCQPNVNNGKCVPTPPPDPSFISGPDDPNVSSSAAFDFSDPATGVTFLCTIDGGTTQEVVVDPCSSGVAFFQGYGHHTFQVAAEDAYGNVSKHSAPIPAFQWTNVPPTPGIDSGPANGSSTESKSAKFTFDDSDSSLSFVCSQDGSTYTACSPTAGPGSGEQDYAGPLALGPQNFYVKATDGSGHYSSPATVQWTILPTCDAGTGSTQAAYNAMPTDITHCGPASESFEADADNEFGDGVTLDTTGGTSLHSLTVDLQSYGCGDSGHWNTGATDACVTTPGPGATFTIPGGITANIYLLNPDGSVGSLLATSTITPSIPYRPSADPTRCPGGVSGVEAGSQWYDPLAKACRYSISDLITFNDWSANPTFSNAEQVIWTVQFNTSDAGYHPIGQGTTCFSSAVGCGYDSLNVGALSFKNAPYAGADVSEDQAYLSYDNGYGGTVNPLQAQGGWTGYRPLGEIVLG